MTRSQMARAALVLRRYVSGPRGPTATALEIVRNAALPIRDGDPVYNTFYSMIEHRVAHGWIACSDILQASIDVTIALRA